MEQVLANISGVVESFLIGKRVSGCTQTTLDSYRMWLLRFAQDTNGVLDPLTVRQWFAALQSQNLAPSSVHKAYQVVRTLLRWLVAVGTIDNNPLRGLSLRAPRTLPRVPTEDELRAVLRSCPPTFEGRRNRAMILVMADAGLRASEVLHLLIEDWKPLERSLFIRSGKGQKDRVAFVAPTTWRAVRASISMRPSLNREDWLFAAKNGGRLDRRYLLSILHRLSGRAGLPRSRRLHPHALRHFAATSWLRNGMGLDEVRRLLGHSSLSTTLRYSSLVATDLQRAHHAAAALERMRLD